MKLSRLLEICIASTLLWNLGLKAYAADPPPCACLNRLDKQVKAGKIGIAIHYLDSGKELFVNGDERFPLQSVFKAPLAVAVLREVDAHKFALDKKVNITQNDVSVYHSPIRKELAGGSKDFTIAELITRAVTESDNTAADYLMRMIGGPQQVQSSLKTAGVIDLSIDRYELQLQPELLGLPAYQPGHHVDENEFERKIASADPKLKQAALQRYLRDRRDTATPRGAMHFLDLLRSGKLLSADSTKFLIGVMEKTVTGPHRIMAALPKGAKVAHKTGTGPNVGGINGGTNDIGIVTLPSGKSFAIAVFLKASTLLEQQRDNLIKQAAACAIECQP